MIKRWWRHAGLRQRLAVLWLAVALVSLVGAIGATVAFQGQRASQITLTDEISPATIATGKWSAAAQNQLTAVFAFTTTAEPVFLDDFQEATERSDALEEEVRRALVNHPRLLSRVDEVTHDLDTWLVDHALPAIAATQEAVDTTEPGTGGSVESHLQTLRSSFDPVNQDVLALEEALEETRAAARDDLERNTRELMTTSSLVVIVILGALGLVWLMLNRWVLQPLQRVGDDTRTVVDGQLDHEVRAEGPPELEQLGHDVEAMRLRIVEELKIVQSAVTELERQALDLNRSNAELEQFAYVASHDLQEPLRKVTGFCQLLQRRYEGQLDDKADEYIAFAVDGAKRMQLLINDLLAFSRVGRTTERFEQVDLNRIMEAVHRELSATIDEQGATVRWHDLPTVWGDPRLLHSLLVNLTANGLKFRRDVQPSVTWSATQDDDHWELRCEDNGIGIEPQFAEKVFEIFQRLHTRDTYEGTGIGLALARKIVEFHGGRIRVDTTADAPGTTMVITLPTAGPEETP